MKNSQYSKVTNFARFDALAGGVRGRDLGKSSRLLSPDGF